MSIMSKNRIGAPSLLDLKKQASFFFKEKLKTARLALTDVTPLQLMTEEATDCVAWGPNPQTLGFISKAAFEFEDYLRIVDVLHKRLTRFDKRNWRIAYNSLIIVEHLLTHGPESVSDEFQGDRDVISQMQTFQQIDEKGFNWGLAVRQKSDKVLKLLEKGDLLKGERKRARELSRGIKGFGSFDSNSSSSSSSQCMSENEVLQNDQEKEETGTGMKENMDPEDDENSEVDPLLGCGQKMGQDIADEDENHPFIMAGQNNHK